MIGKNRRSRTVFATAVLAAASLIFTSLPANANSTGVSSSEIKLGITVPSNLFGYNKIGNAMKAYFDYVNANGGVNGRKIRLIIEDDLYSPKVAVEKSRKLVTRDKVFALVGALGTANYKSSHASLNLGGRGIPSLFVNTGFSGFADRRTYPTTFTYLPSYAMEGKFLAKILKEKYANQKTALVYQDDDFGDDVRKGFTLGAYKFTSETAYSTATIATEAGNIANNLKTAGAETVVLFGVTQAVGAIMGAAARLQYAPKWIIGSVGADAVSLRALGVPAAVIAGARGASFLPSPTDTNDPYVKQFQEINAEYNKGVAFDNNVLVAMNSAMLVVQALRAAGPRPTRASLIRGLQTKGASFAHAGLVPLNFSSTSNVGYNGYWFGQYDSNLVLKPVDGTLEVFTTDSANGPITKSDYKRPAMPAKGLPTNS